MSNQHLPAPPADVPSGHISTLAPPTASARAAETRPNENRHGRFVSEVMAGGSVTEASDDEVAGGWRGVAGLAVIIGLFVWLGFSSLWWLVFVLGIAVAIFLHELGHFMTARWTGMKATQFFIGFGPRIWSFRRGETEYGVRLLPLGAFVRIIGMNSMDDVPEADEARTYRSKSYPRRLLVISAGSIMHMLIAIVLLFVVYAVDGESVVMPGVKIATVSTSSPAAAAGLQADDIILSVDGEQLDSSKQLGATIQKHAAGEVLNVEITRGDQALTVPVTLATNTDQASELAGKPYIGVSTDPVVVTQPHSIPGAAVNAVTDIFPQSWQMAQGAIKVLNPLNVFGHLNGTNTDVNTRPTTLVGVTSISDDVGREFGIIGILFMLAMLNVFVGVFNMLPLLPLDGGHAAIATYERVRERKGVRYYADVEKLMPFAMAVMVMLLFLFMSGLYLDITQPVG